MPGTRALMAGFATEVVEADGVKAVGGQSSQIGVGLGLGIGLTSGVGLHSLQVGDGETMAMALAPRAIKPMAMI